MGGASSQLIQARRTATGGDGSFPGDVVMKRQTITTAILAALAIACVALPTGARANTVDIVHNGYGANNSTIFTAAGHVNAEVVAGVYDLYKSAGTGVGNTWPDGTTIPGFCIELQETHPTTTQTYQVMMPEDVYNSIIGETLGTTKANYLRELWAR